MSIVPVKYPYDPTGKAATNLVPDELHQLNNANFRVLVPRYGAFYTESVSLREAASGKPLVPGRDYYPAMLYKLPTMETGQEVHQIIIITNPAVSSNVLFTAQMLGGEYSYSWDAIVQMIQSLKLDQRSVVFENIIGKPEKWEPAPHLHDIGDVYGFEYQVAALERLAQAIKMGGGAQLQGIYQYLDNQLAEINNTLEAALAGQGTQASIIEALGFTPANRAGDDFTGLMKFKKGFLVEGALRERIQRITATSNTTTLDLSLATIFDVVLSASTSFRFDLTKVPNMQPNEAISFTLVVRNDNTPNRAVAFPSNIKWAGKVIPPRSTGAQAQDEFYFSSFDGGVTWTGSLSNADVGQVTA